MKRTTLSFLTESKGSHVGIISMRRVAITLLVMLLTTVSAWAEDVPTYSISTLLSPMNGGTISVPTQATQGTKVQFTVTPADGYQIDEVLLSDSQISLEENSETGSYSFTMGTSNVLITVVFKKGLAVTFDANRGTGAMKHVIVANGTKYTIPECGFTGPNNQAFIGWSTVANGNVEYQPGDKVKINNNLTLYAIWEDYHLILNPNYDGGLDKNITVSFLNPTYTLTSADVPTREGYTFYGWSTSPTGDVKYRTNDKITLTGNLTLYAIWDDTPSNFTLKYKILASGREVALIGHSGNKPRGTLNIPTTVTIDNTEYSVTRIGGSAFLNCTDLTSIDIPNSVTSIENNAFSYCLNLQSVTIPNSVTSIMYSVFYNCSGLTSIDIPNSVTSIGNNAFSYCLNLQSVTIPNSVTSIGNYAFNNCSSLQSVTIPNSVTSIGDCAFSNSGLQSVTIPNSVTSIEAYTFSGCSSLQSVDIPESVTNIGNKAFYQCSALTSVTIPNNVTSIGEDAFWGCSNLTSVTINGNPKIGRDAFFENPATVKMNLTASKIDGNYWTTFYNNGYNFQADENTTVYKGTVNESSLVLTEVEDRIVNRGTAVILKSSGNPVMTLTKTNSSDTNGNSLCGYSERKSLAEVKSANNANTIYTLGNTSAGFGFHRYTGEFVPAGKAFLPLYTSDGAKAQSLTIVFAIGSTGINSVSSDSNEQNDWFSLNGTRLSGKPSQPGIYVNGKKKVVIK